MNLEEPEVIDAFGVGEAGDRWGAGPPWGCNLT
jgi:hypothetical protein